MSAATVVEPGAPRGLYLHIHTHDWYQVGANLNPNGRWSSVWSCRLCPDIGSGGYIGPEPAGLCACQFVTSTAGATRCADCGRTDAFVTSPPTADAPDPLESGLASWFTRQHDLHDLRRAALEARLAAEETS